MSKAIVEKAFKDEKVKSNMHNVAIRAPTFMRALLETWLSTCKTAEEQTQAAVEKDAVEAQVNDATNSSHASTSKKRGATSKDDENSKRSKSAANKITSSFLPLGATTAALTPEDDDEVNAAPIKGLNAQSGDQSAAENDGLDPEDAVEAAIPPVSTQANDNIDTTALDEAPALGDVTAVEIDPCKSSSFHAPQRRANVSLVRKCQREQAFT